jgi:hypothetical protein
MQKNIFYVSIAIMSIFATDVMADDDACRSPATVYGSVDTINVSESLQVGTIHLQLISEKNGKVVFEEDGGIVGRVTSTNTDEFPLIRSTLNHHIVFADGSTIETNGDQAEMYPTSACSFEPVIEIISNLWGTREFKKASGVILANGTVNFCDGTNGNHFELTGTVCLK